MTLSKRTVVARQRGERIHKLNRLWLSVDRNVAEAERFKRRTKTWTEFKGRAEKTRKLIRVLDPQDRHMGPGKAAKQFANPKAEKRFLHYLACQGTFTLWSRELEQQCSNRDIMLRGIDRKIWEEYFKKGWTPFGALTEVCNNSRIAK